MESLPTGNLLVTSEFQDAASHLMSLAPDPKLVRCYISSVVRRLTSFLIDALHTNFDLKAVEVNARSNHGMAIHYSPPESLGSDRIADATAAVHLFGAPCVTVNFGTATTINVISSVDGGACFEGGAICAGLDMTIAAFASALPSLNMSDLSAPDSVVGGTTSEAISSGVLLGHVAMVDGLVEGMQRDRALGDCPVIATGGHLETLAVHSRKITASRVDLTLLGVLLIGQK
jgi:type III pantothenate kinase